MSCKLNLQSHRIRSCSAASASCSVSRATSHRASSGHLQPCSRPIFGGAPEAVLVGVVALVVFGPKGLADAAKGVGKTLKGFQPTIQELTQVSNELKTTIQTEIGLDEFQRDIASIRNQQPIKRLNEPFEEAAAASRAALSGTATTSSKDSISAKADQINKSVSESNASQDADLEKMRTESAKAAWGTVPSTLSSSDDASAEKKLTKKKALEEMSLVELEAELAKRKALIAELSKDA